MATSLVAALAVIGGVLSTTSAAAADFKASCARGIDGLVQVSIVPVPKEEVQLFADGSFVQVFDHGSVTVPVVNLDGAQTVEIWGVVSHRALATVSLSSCSQPFDIYTTPGQHSSGGRDWRTTCEPYSQSQRCRTEIWSTQVVLKNGKFVSTTGWNFNNLTYLPMPRSVWKGNPLGNAGSWTASDGSKWRTECDNATTGRNACRSYRWTAVVKTYKKPDGTTYYGGIQDWVFNNIVRFS